MASLRGIHQNISYRWGYGHGLQKREPFKCPWWVDHVAYSVAYTDGLEARPEK